MFATVDAAKKPINTYERYGPAELLILLHQICRHSTKSLRIKLTVSPSRDEMRAQSLTVLYHHLQHGRAGMADFQFESALRRAAQRACAYRQAKLVRARVPKQL